MHGTNSAQAQGWHSPGLQTFRACSSPPMLLAYRLDILASRGVYPLGTRAAEHSNEQSFPRKRARVFFTAKQFINLTGLKGLSLPRVVISL